MACGSTGASRDRGLCREVACAALFCDVERGRPVFTDVELLALNERETEPAIALADPATLAGELEVGGDVTLAHRHGWLFARGDGAEERPLYGSQVAATIAEGHAVYARRAVEPLASGLLRTRYAVCLQRPAELAAFASRFDAPPPPLARVRSSPIERLTTRLVELASRLEPAAIEETGPVYPAAGLRGVRAAFGRLPARARAQALGCVARCNAAVAADLAGLSTLRFHATQRTSHLGLSHAVVFSDPEQLATDDAAIALEALRHLAATCARAGGAAAPAAAVQASRALFAQLGASERVQAVAQIASVHPPLAADLLGLRRAALG